jgi:hypothetical protein
MGKSAKVVPLRAPEEPKREVVFLDAEDNAVDIQVQTDQGKVGLWDWMEQQEDIRFKQGYKLGTYHWALSGALFFALVAQIYIVTFFYQSEELRLRAKARYEIELRAKTLDLTPRFRYGP